MIIDRYWKNANVVFKIRGRGWGPESDKNQESGRSGPVRV